MFDGRGTKRPRLADPQHASSDSGGSSRWQPESHSHRKASPESSDQYYTDPDLELFSDKSLFAVDVPALENGPVFGGEKSSFFDSTISSSAIDNFQYDQFALETQLLSWASVSSVGEPSEDSPAYDEEREWIAQILRPSLPLLEDRIVNLRLDNPYDDNGESRHKTLREEVFQPQNGAVNGYIKFRILDADLSDRNNRAGLLGQAALGLHRRRKFQDSEAEGPFSHVPRLPPDFGRGLKLNQTDSKLLKFYLVAYCQGRTLLPGTNFWLNEIAPMMAGNEAVKHAVLALAGAYLLDYVRKDGLRETTNKHYRLASELISSALREPETHDVAKSDAIVSVILLLQSDDVVNWEQRKPHSEIPNWYRGAHLAKRILNHSDPGYRYWKLQNVQCDKVHVANANRTAFSCILVQPVTPLPLLEEADDRNFAWLLEGTKREVHTIQATGLSPKLLHTFAQITQLCARMMKIPSSIIVPVAAERIVDILRGFRQRSELSEGVPSTAALLAAYELDEAGKVQSATAVTELTGEAWVHACKIYLHIRFFRKPRSHPDVRAALDVLIQCIRLMPCGGHLFTSQSPFFCVFLMAIVSYRPEDRAVAREWYETVLSAASCRSSVPPVWEIIKTMWVWMDTETPDAGFDESIAVGLRTAWWENVVSYLMEKFGWISLT